MRVVVVGANGQLAHDLIPTLEGADYEVVGLVRSQVDVTDFGSLREILSRAEPQMVVNTSAYHRVDNAEQDPDLAFAVNAVGPRNLALVCRQLSASLVHMSTDYVFSGSKGRPYVESDRADPVNIYGVSKVAGEMTIRYLWARHYVVRSSGLYGVAGSSGKGGNFVETMLRLAREGRPIRVVHDQGLTPTSTRALAAQIVKLIGSDAYGTYHATCQGECTWYEFATEIFRLNHMCPELAPQTTIESGALAMRPPYSVLENANLKRVDIDLMPPWQEALSTYLRERKYKRSPQLTGMEGAPACSRPS